MPVQKNREENLAQRKNLSTGDDRQSFTSFLTSSATAPPVFRGHPLLRHQARPPRFFRLREQHAAPRQLREKSIAWNCLSASTISQAVACESRPPQQAQRLLCKAHRFSAATEKVGRQPAQLAHRLLHGMFGLGARTSAGSASRRAWDIGGQLLDAPSRQTLYPLCPKPPLII